MNNYYNTIINDNFESIMAINDQILRPKLQLQLTVCYMKDQKFSYVEEVIANLNWKSMSLH